MARRSTNQCSVRGTSAVALTLSTSDQTKERAMSNTPTTTITNCRARAYDYLVNLVGGLPETLTWDSTHCLQGHLQVGGHDLVIIATRDPSHEPVVLAASSWDAVRRCPDGRRDFMKRCAITDHSSLVSVLELDVRLAA
jgi:hypothetical protein